MCVKSLVSSSTIARKEKEKIIIFFPLFLSFHCSLHQTHISTSTKSPQWNCFALAPTKIIYFFFARLMTKKILFGIGIFYAFRLMSVDFLVLTRFVCVQGDKRSGQQKLRCHIWQLLWLLPVFGACKNYLHFTRFAFSRIVLFILRLFEMRKSYILLSFLPFFVHESIECFLQAVIYSSTEQDQKKNGKFLIVMKSTSHETTEKWQNKNTEEKTFRTKWCNWSNENGNKQL